MCHTAFHRPLAHLARRLQLGIRGAALLAVLAIFKPVETFSMDAAAPTDVEMPMTPSDPATSRGNTGDDSDGAPGQSAITEDQASSGGAATNVRVAGVEEITVTGAQQSQPTLETQASRLKSINVIGIEEIARSQSADVFEAVRDMPGVTIEGGPRTSGKSFSIRGFSSNEDVLIQIDGVTQNFEKYRYGAGVDIDPELLKQIEVQRGGAAVTQGSGYIGGMVRMETKDASDLLEGDENWAASAKSGYQTNNDGKLYSLTAYGRPARYADTLFNVTKRQTNDYELPDGTRYKNSQEGQLSGLGKLKLYRGDVALSATQRHAEDSGLEPFDITGGVTGIGGNVRRRTGEDATALRLQWTPGSPYLDIDATLGYISKNVTDDGSAIAGVDLNGNPIGTDTFDYEIWNSSVLNTMSIEGDGVSNRLQMGVQGNRERRTAIRENLNGVAPNPAQPSGEKQVYAVLAHDMLAWRGWMLEGGIRHDWYRVSPGHDTQALLTARGLATGIQFDRTTPSYGLSYEYGPLSLFYRWSRTFRAPLLDEYFGRGSFSSCFEFSAFEHAPVPPANPVLSAAPTPPNFSDFTDVFAHLAALDQYNNIDLPAYLRQLSEAVAQFNAAFAAYQEANAAFLANPAGDHSAFCGDFYKPETAVTREAGLALQFDDVATANDRLTIKMTYYDVRVRNLLESIYESAVTHEIRQPGKEVRTGFEVEVHYDQQKYFADLSLTTLDGYFQYNFFADNIDPSVAALGDPGTTALFNQPGNSLNVTLGVRPRWNVEIGHRLRLVSSRTVTVGVLPDCPGGLFTNPVCNVLGEQAGYITSNWFAAWQPDHALDLRLTIDNALNKQFELSGFGGALGAIAPGRDIRVSINYRY